jgi:uncharacterized protein YmfQ (DUF2313 family)
MSDFAITSPNGQRMFANLPTYYEKSRVMRVDMNAKGVELDYFTQALNEVLDQFFVSKATWGIKIWENELNLTIDTSKPIEQRRSVVESKLRGAGKFSGQLVKNVAEAYDGGTVDVSFRPAEYAFTVRFIDTLGIPPNLDDLKAAIEEIKPAHMTVDYKYRYLLIREINNTMTLNKLQQRKLTDFAPFLE